MRAAWLGTLGGVGVALAACDPTDRVGGVSGAYFTNWERVSDGPLTVDGEDAQLAEIDPEGRPVVIAGSAWWVGRERLGGLGDPPPEWIRIGALGEWSRVERGADALVVMRFGTSEVYRWSEGGLEPIALPTPAFVPTDVLADDRGRVYLGGVEETPSPLGGPRGAVYTSDDDGRTWAPHLEVLVAGPAADPSSSASTVELWGVDGFVTGEVCHTGCWLFRGVPGDLSHIPRDPGASLGPASFALDADGAILMGGRPDAERVIPGVLRLEDADERDFFPEDLGHVHVGWSEVPLESVDGEGFGWGYGHDLETWGVMRTVAPLGTAHDQRRLVLDGRGCEDFYVWDPAGEPQGNDMDWTLTNGRDEPLWLGHVTRRGATLAFPGAPAALQPGQTVTLRDPEHAWMMALTADGRCAGYGMVRKLDGRTL